MPIPSFTTDEVLPPFVGAQGPGGAPADMSPYIVTALEVVTHLGNTSSRSSILQGWLDHRAAMRSAGFGRGFQWLDGSFVENKTPRDLDVVTFLYRPPTIRDCRALNAFIGANPDIFDYKIVRNKYNLDFFPVDLNASPGIVVEMSRYYFGLFSHRRDDFLWKGMLQVSLDDPNHDHAALAALASNSNF